MVDAVLTQGAPLGPKTHDIRIEGNGSGVLPAVQGKRDENSQRLALLSLGEIGRSIDLSSNANVLKVVTGLAPRQGRISGQRHLFAARPVATNAVCL